MRRAAKRPPRQAAAQLPSRANSVGARGRRDQRRRSARPVHRHELRATTPSRVDHRADPGGGRAQHRQPFLDRAQPRLRQMLRRAPGAEPAVVGGIEDVVGPVRAVDHLAREDDLVADLHPGLAPGAEVERARPGPGQKSIVPGDQPRRGRAARAASASADIRRKAPDAPWRSCRRSRPRRSSAVTAL